MAMQQGNHGGNPPHHAHRQFTFAIIALIFVLIAIGGLIATQAHSQYVHMLRSMSYQQPQALQTTERRKHRKHIITVAERRNRRNETQVQILETFLQTLPRPHPHAGARDADGTWGYVADVTAVRTWMLGRYQRRLSKKIFTMMSFLPFHSSVEKAAVCDEVPKLGPEKKAGWRLLTTKVRVKESQLASAKGSHPKLLCAIYTHDKRNAQITAISETWAWRCDGFFAASTRTIKDPKEPGFGSIDLPHLGPEEYGNMWQKTRSIWAYIHDNYLEDFQYFFLSGDDTHVIVENLLSLLDEFVGVDNAPMYLGHWIFLRGANMKFANGTHFCGGGPGYVLNREAVRRLIQVLPNCFDSAQVAAEDRFMGYCLHQAGIVSNHSVDAVGAQRFHGSSANFVASYTGNRGYYKDVYRFWGSLYGYKTGFDLVSSESVSFHHVVSPIHMKRHHALLYRSCPRGTTVGDYFAINTPRTEFNSKR